MLHKCLPGIRSRPVPSLIVLSSDVSRKVHGQCGTGVDAAVQQKVDDSSGQYSLSIDRVAAATQQKDHNLTDLNG